MIKEMEGQQRGMETRQEGEGRDQIGLIQNSNEVNASGRRRIALPKVLGFKGVTGLFPSDQNYFVEELSGFLETDEHRVVVYSFSGNLRRNLMGPVSKAPLYVLHVLSGSLISSYVAYAFTLEREGALRRGRGKHLVGSYFRRFKYTNISSK